MISDLLSPGPLGKSVLSTNLRGIAGYTGTGSIRYVRHSNGERILKISLCGIGGKIVDICDQKANTLSINVVGGSAKAQLNSRKGTDIPEFESGDIIEIRQNSDIILSGTFG